MKELLTKVPKFLFFTGKGGVGKTSMSCSISLALSLENKKVLLISTDPASNLDEVLNTKLCSTPTKVNETNHLWAMNINPVVAANEYKEKMVSPYRDILPKEAIVQMEEQLSGACTVEIAGFNEFSRYVGEEEIINNYDHIILDTAPTGHTLRLLSLPSAWNEFIADNETGSSCLGPVSGLVEYKKLYDKVLDNLKDKEQTLLVLVSRAEELSLIEANKASLELNEQGMKNQHLIINAVFSSEDVKDEVAQSFAQESEKSLDNIPNHLKTLSQTKVGFYPKGVLGLKSLKHIIHNDVALEFNQAQDLLEEKKKSILKDINTFDSLVNELEKDKKGLIMTMGKGGVGKTTIASMIAQELSLRGHKVVLSTTDPASHLEYTASENKNLLIEKIDPKIETKRHVDLVLEKNKDKLNESDMALLEEELRSPCIEEIAVFEAFCKTVNKAKDAFVILDTAPTGHTLLLLDASNAYHKEVLKNNHTKQEDLALILPRIKDQSFTKILLVTLAEATPTHEAKDLQEDLKRAGIKPFSWLINKSFAASDTSNNLLCQKALDELKYIDEVKTSLSNNTVLLKRLKQR